MGRHGLRLLGLGLLRAARRGPARGRAAVRRVRRLGRAGRGHLGDDLRQRRPHVHGRRRAALRHERAPAGRRALDDRVAAHRAATRSAIRRVSDCVRLSQRCRSCGRARVAVARSRDGRRAQAPRRSAPAAKPGTQCQPGNNRQTPGGGDKASHEGWPAISGVFWKVIDGEPHVRGRPAERRAARPPRQRRHPRRRRRRRDLGRLGPRRQRPGTARSPVRRGRRRLDLLEPRDATPSARAAATTSSGRFTAGAPSTAALGTTPSASDTATSTASETAKKDQVEARGPHRDSLRRPVCGGGPRACTQRPRPVRARPAGRAVRARQRPADARAAATR